MANESHIGNGFNFHRDLDGPYSGRPGKWFVIDCSCGWSTPICANAKRCKELFENHRSEAVATNQESNSLPT